MNKEKKLIRNISLQVATAGVSGLLLASPVYAQSDSMDQDQQASQSKNQQVEQAARAEFTKLDGNNDQKLEWDELKVRLETPDLRDEWDQDKLMSEFDENDNDALEPDEYQLFLVEAIHTGTQNQQRRTVEVESADVTVDPGQPKVNVTQKSPDVQVQQAETDVSVERQPPKVTVRQPAPEVTITQPKPEVQVRMPKPEVEVTQQDPSINVDQGKPEVQIEQQKPKVVVKRGEPEVQVAEQQPKVVLQREQPDVSIADRQQETSVQTQQGDKQAQVQVEQSKPQVEVSEAEPEVTLERSGEADVNVQRPGQEQGQQKSQETGQEMAAASGANGAQQSLDSMSIDELRGHKVVNSLGDELGKVDQVVVSGDQRTAGAVLSMGGILGIGAQQVLAPLDQLSLQNDRLVWETSMTRDELKQSSSYVEENYNNVSADKYRNLGELKQGTGQ
jgi:hypothetical protein